MEFELNSSQKPTIIKRDNIRFMVGKNDESSQFDLTNSKLKPQMYVTGNFQYKLDIMEEARSRERHEKMQKKKRAIRYSKDMISSR